MGYYRMPLAQKILLNYGPLVSARAFSTLCNLMWTGIAVTELGLGDFGHLQLVLMLAVAVSPASDWDGYQSQLLIATDARNMVANSCLAIKKRLKRSILIAVLFQFSVSVLGASILEQLMAGVLLISVVVHGSIFHF
jgi:hypothetical protein